MADIFISYKREDRPFAERLSIALEQLGFDVWWDFELLSGDRYRKVIRAVIDQCPAAIVLWSERAVESDFVLDEASHALRLGKLCPARIDGVPLPFGFGQSHTDDLATWEGELSHPGFQALVRAIEARVGRKGRLGAAAHNPASQAATAELESFKAAQIAGNASAMRAFLASFPRGQFAQFVRGQLETIEADARVSAPVSAPISAPAPSPSPPPIASPIRDDRRDAPPSPQPPPAPPKRSPWPLIGGIGAVVALIALAIVLMGEPPADPTAPDASKLDPSVREVVLKAREAAARAVETATKAREEKRLAEQSGAVQPTDGRGVDLFSGDFAGDEYAGMHRNGVREGLGVMTYADNVMSRQYNRARYEGGWAHNGRGGVGVFYWNDGRRYAGEFANERESGLGVMTFTDGSRYEGEWANDQYEGYGVFWSASGEPVSAGIWAANNLTRAIGDAPAKPTVRSVTPAPPRFRPRSDFDSDDSYAAYVRSNLHPGDRVVAIKTFQSVPAGSIGTFYGDLGGAPPAFVRWDTLTPAGCFKINLNGAPPADDKHGFCVFYDALKPAF